MNSAQSQTNDNDGDGVARNAVVLVVDGLSAAMLGAYGNTWFETANFNRLAARSLLFDYAFASSPNIEQAYRRFWNPDSSVDGNQNESLNLIDTVANLGAVTSLLTDEPLLSESGLADSFDQVTQVVHPPTSGLADQAEDTELANFFAQATGWLVNLEPGSLAWIHSKGLTGAWDAPHQLRCSLAGEGDPVPGEFYQPPSGTFDLEQDDPDDLLGYQQACAAQVILLDRFLGVLLDLMESDPVWQSTLLCFTSTRGYPLGEHGILGLPSNYNESVHVPMMLAVPSTSEFSDFRAVRNRSLQQTDLINDRLVEWFDDDESLFVDRLRSVAFEVPELCNQSVVIEHGVEAEDGGRRVASVQTHAWKLIRRTTQQGSQIDEQFELYAKPDDRWEVNDVSRRCPHIVESLSNVLDKHLKAGGLGGSGELRLDEALWNRSN